MSWTSYPTLTSQVCLCGLIVAMITIYYTSNVLSATQTSSVLVHQLKSSRPDRRT